MNTQRSLRVGIGEREIGSLIESNGLWSFRYSELWLKDNQAFALSPHLPLQETALVDGASVRHVQWYFDNLLPEESQRALLATDASISGADAFGLLQYYGAESAGSLTLTPGTEPFPVGGEYVVLTDAALSARIAQLPRLPLTHGAPKRMSLAGAQHKLAVILSRDALYEPLGATASSHILKPDHERRDLYPHSAINEWFIMRLAANLGLLVPTTYRRYVPDSIYLVERFDRLELKGSGESQWQRLHAIDACQLLGLDRAYKYASGSIEILNQLIAQCRSRAGTRTRLFEWLVFNLLVGNNDAHLKNLSFLVDQNGIELAPHYDLICTAIYEDPSYGGRVWPENSTLAWPMLGKSHFADIDHDHLLEVGLTLGIQSATAHRLLERLISQIGPRAQHLYEQVCAENEVQQQIMKALGPTFAGEERCLRAIIHNVIMHMALQLR